MSKIEKMNAQTGRMMKEDDSVINIADVLSDVYDSTNGVIKTVSEVDPSTATIATNTDTIADEVNEFKDMAMGQLGSKRISDATSTTPTNPLVFVSIQATEDTVFDTLTGNMSNTTGLTLLAGSIIYGRFSVVKLTSGKVIAYMGV